MMQKRNIGLLIPKVMLFLLFGVLTAQAKSPNFIFILSDDQSWKGTSVLMNPELPESRSDYYRTPNLERLASMGMRFTDGYAPGPYCCPTRRSLQIGQSPARHIYQQDQTGWTDYYRQQPNLCGVLKDIDKTYKTAHFGKWDHRFDEITPAEMGYDESDGPTGNADGGSKNSGGPAAKEDPKKIDYLTDRACGFIENCVSQDNPFYLQVSHYAVHLDIYYKQETLGAVNKREKGTLHDISTFAAMTEDLDTGIGRLLNKVEELSLLDNTYIIFMSDNGGRRTMPGEKTQDLNLPLRNGKGTMYEGGIRVPFMICGPGIEKNVCSSVPVSGVDLLPTLADLAGGTIQHERLDGGSLKNLIKGKTDSVQRNQDFLVFHHSVRRKPQSAIRLGNYKLVKTYLDNKVELFDLSKDLEEKNNLANQMPAKTKELEAALESYLHQARATVEYTGK